MSAVAPFDMHDIDSCVALAEVEPDAFMLPDDPAERPDGYDEATVTDLALLADGLPEEERDAFLQSFIDRLPQESWHKIVSAYRSAGSTTALFTRLGMEPFMELVASGVSMARICKTMNLSYVSAMDYIRGSSQRRALYAEAKELSAETYADRATRVLEEANLNVDGALRRAVELSKQLRWMAERRAPKEFMPTPDKGDRGAAVGVTFIWNAPGTPPPVRVIEQES